MQGVSFSLDWFALSLALPFTLLVFLIRHYAQQQPTPHIRFSTLIAPTTATKGWRAHLQGLPQALNYAAFFCLLTAFIDPHIYLTKESQKLPPPHIVQGIGIYLVLDQSGSMEEKEPFVLPDGTRQTISKIDLLKQVTEKFVQDRPNDMIGLVEFSRGAHVIAPLTLDHDDILQKLKQLQVMKIKDQDGTSIGYAIYKTANLIAATRHFAQDIKGQGKPAYDIKSTIMILVTDGLQDPNPLDKGKRLRNLEISEAAQLAKQLGVRLYMINVEPKLAAQKEYEPNFKEMREATELTGGKFFLMNGTTRLSDIYSQIDRLEKSNLPQEADLLASLPKDKRPGVYQRISFYPYLIACALFFLFLAAALRSTWLRTVP